MELKQPLTKLYYSIGELAELFDVNTSLIRYWEKEFTLLHPKKSKAGIRKYTQKDIENFNKVYALVKEKGFTIDGAKKALKESRSGSDDLGPAKPVSDSMAMTLDKDVLLSKLETSLSKLRAIQRELKEITNPL